METSVEIMRGEDDIKMTFWLIVLFLSQQKVIFIKYIFFMAGKWALLCGICYELDSKRHAEAFG